MLHLYFLPMNSDSLTQDCSTSTTYSRFKIKNTVEFNKLILLAVGLTNISNWTWINRCTVSCHVLLHFPTTRKPVNKLWKWHQKPRSVYYLTEKWEKHPDIRTDRDGNFDGTLKNTGEEKERIHEDVYCWISTKPQWVLLPHGQLTSSQTVL